MKSLMLVISLTLLMSSTAFAGKKVAVVGMLRGQVEVVDSGKTLALKDKDSVEDGVVIKTAEKSFVKLVFFDKSQMNIGPNSEMKIAKFTGEDSGVIDLVKGKIRSQVTKDYLQMKDKDKSKLFIKTPNAVMGIRGTDFMISTNGKNTSAILFEGEVVFNKLDARSETRSEKLEDIVDKGVRMHPGEFSVMDQSRSIPTEPALLNIQQIEKLEKNETFEADRNPSNAKVEEPKNSVVPEGLDGAVVSNNSETLKDEVSKVASVEPAKVNSDAQGFVDGDKVKPTNGSFVHVESGVIIPPAPGSILDKNTNTYISGSSSGTVNADGNFIPPKNVEITPDGKIFVAVTDKTGATRVQEIEKPAPVMSATSVGLGQIVQVINQNPTMINPTQPIKNDILNAQFTPSGLNDLSNLQRNTSGGVTAEQSQSEILKTNLTVKPVRADN